MTTRTSACNCGQLGLTYDGPDPERISLCQCFSCQKRSGSVLSVQTRLPRDHVTIDGESKTWSFPQSGKPPVSYRSCDSSGATYHFCAECGSTVYWTGEGIPGLVAVAIGTFADPNFPAPTVSVWEECRHAWVPAPSDPTVRRVGKQG